MKVLELMAEFAEDDRQRQNAVKEALCHSNGLEIDFGANYEHFRLILPGKMKGMHPFLDQMLTWDWVFMDDNTDDVIIFHADAYTFPPLRKL